MRDLDAVDVGAGFVGAAAPSGRLGLGVVELLLTDHAGLEQLAGSGQLLFGKIRSRPGFARPGLGRRQVLRQLFTLEANEEVASAYLLSFASADLHHRAIGEAGDHGADSGRHRSGKLDEAADGS